jgi:hypothetical protein
MNRLMPGEGLLPTITRSCDALTVAGKVAGLGDETQINVAVTADVACVNPGNNEPKAENKGDTPGPRFTTSGQTAARQGVSRRPDRTFDSRQGRSRDSLGV